MNNDQPTPPKTPPVNTAPEDPGKTLGIVGFILAFLASFIGLIVSIIAFSKSKKAGYTNGLALAGIILGVIFTILSTLVIVAIMLTAYNGISEKAKNVHDVATKCESTDQSRVYVGGEWHACDNNSDLSPDKSRTSADDTIDIAKSPVTLDGSTVNAACFSFSMPAEYIMNPNSTTCQTELRLKSNSSSGVSLTAILAKAQTGDSTIEDFFRKYKAAGGDKVSDEKRMTINGYNAASLTLTNSLGVKQAVYFIVDDSGKFKASNGTVTSYLIYGPAHIKEPLDTVVNSFRIK